MKKIPVNNGKFYALVDDGDFKELSQYKWYVAGSRKSYACRQYQKKNMKYYVYMHRAIMDAPSDMIVDHINGDTLDNRRSNLRLCTTAQNSYNSKTPKHNTSGFKGVHYYKARNNYQVKIQVDGKTHNIGYFDAIEDAVAARAEAATRLHGDFARS